MTYLHQLTAPITGENAESTVNKQGNADGESTQPKQSRRDLLEAWKAQKEYVPLSRLGELDLIHPLAEY